MTRKRFRTPPTLPEETQCRGTVIPSSREWLGIYSDALLSLTEPWNYEQVSPTDLTPEETAALCYEQYLAWLDSTCAGGATIPELPGSDAPVYRVNPTTGRWEYIDNGEWVEPSGENAIPEPAAREEATEALQNCGAASNAAHALRELYTNILSVYDSEVDPLVNQAEIAAQIAVSIGAMFGPISAAFLEAAGGLWAIFKAGLDTVTEADWSDEFESELVCILEHNLTNTDGVVTFNHYGVCSDLVGFLLPVVDEFVRVRWQTWYLLQCIGAQGLNIAGGATAVEGDCATCDTWCYAANLGDFTFSSFPTGYIDSNGDGKMTYSYPYYEFTAWITVDTTHCVITRLYMSGSRGSSGPGLTATLYMPDAATPNYLATTLTGGAPWSMITEDNPAKYSNTNTTTIRFNCSAYGSDPGATLEGVRIYGTGINPFAIGSNC